MKILHRFGVVCFWAGVIVAAICLVWIGLIFSEPGGGWREGSMIAISVGAFAALAGCAIRFIFGWRIHDI